MSAQINQNSLPYFGALTLASVVNTSQLVTHYRADAIDSGTPGSTVTETPNLNCLAAFGGESEILIHNAPKVRIAGAASDASGDATLTVQVRRKSDSQVAYSRTLTPAEQETAGWFDLTPYATGAGLGAETNFYDDAWEIHFINGAGTVLATPPSQITVQFVVGLRHYGHISN